MRRTHLAALYLVVLGVFGEFAAAQATAPATRPGTPAEIGPETPPGVYTSPPPGANWQPAPAPRAYVPRRPQFAAGRFDLSLDARGLTTFGSSGGDSLVFVTLSADFYILNGLSIGLEGGLAPGTASDHHHHDNHDDDDEDGVRAEDGRFVARWRFITVSAFSAYVDAGIGGLHASHEYPSGGQKDYFMAGVGLGASWRLVRGVYLAGGARFDWLGTDEGNSDDFDRHHHHWHGYDAVEYYGGFTFVP